MSEVDIAHLESIVKRMKEQNDKLFEELGISPEVLSSILADKSRFTPEEWNQLEQHKTALEEWIASSQPPPVQKRQSSTPGHWIFVR
jgi:hypothetical protein